MIIQITIDSSAYQKITIPANYVLGIGIGIGIGTSEFEKLQPATYHPPAPIISAPPGSSWTGSSTVTLNFESLNPESGAPLDFGILGTQIKKLCKCTKETPTINCT
jgi:hypothetical protein